jgi:hypothetical protein
LLADGRVLIAGGAGPLASAEIYNPSTGVFTPTGDMTSARMYHSATLLPDGRVLITGGDAGLVGPELYDPSTGTFTATGITTPVSGMISFGATAALQKNGVVLIAGTNAELYDPVANGLAPTASYVGPFYYGPFYHPDTATLLPDGRALIVGSACGDCWLEHEELYDPVTGTFKVTGKLRTFGLGGDIGSGHTATLLPNGKVLLAGGTGNDFGSFSTGEVYDPSTDTFIPTASMTMARDSQTATLLADGTVLVAGGYFPYNSLISAELYDPFTGTFAATANMTMARAAHTATLLPDGRVLLSGGAGDSGASAEIYTPRVLVPAPALFSISGDGTGQGAIWHADTGKIASSVNPASAGDVLSMYTTNLFEGGVIPPQVAIGGRLAEILFFGDAPGYPGYFQINLRVPAGVVPGASVPVRLIYIGRTSNSVTIGLVDAETLATQRAGPHFR